MTGKLLLGLLVICAVMILPPSESKAQPNYSCIAQGVQAAAAHQCTPEASRFGCRLQKLAVGFGAYVECNGGTLSRFRARRVYRRTYRQQSTRSFQAQSSCGYSYPSNYCGQSYPACY